MLREMLLWGMPSHMLERMLSPSDIDAIAGLSHADMALEVIQLSLRDPQGWFGPGIRTDLVRRFEDTGYTACASPEAAADFLRFSASRRQVSRIASWTTSYCPVSYSQWHRRRPAISFR